MHGRRKGRGEGQLIVIIKPNSEVAAIWKPIDRLDMCDQGKVVEINAPPFKENPRDVSTIMSAALSIKS